MNKKLKNILLSIILSILILLTIIFGTKALNIVSKNNLLNNINKNLKTFHSIFILQRNGYCVASGNKKYGAAFNNKDKEDIEKFKKEFKKLFGNVSYFEHGNAYILGGKNSKYGIYYIESNGEPGLDGGCRIHLILKKGIINEFNEFNKEISGFLDKSKILNALSELGILSKNDLINTSGTKYYSVTNKNGLIEISLNLIGISYIIKYDEIGDLILNDFSK